MPCLYFIFYTLTPVYLRILNFFAFLAQLTSFKHLPDSREEFEPQLENSETKVASHELTSAGLLEPVDSTDSLEPVDDESSGSSGDSAEDSSDESDETSETDDEFDLNFK